MADTNTLRVRLEDRVLIYDPITALVKIRKQSEADNDSNEYWIVPLAANATCWDLYMDIGGISMWAQAPDEKSGGAHFVARVNLSDLGGLGKYLRSCGNLQSIYVVKHNGISTSSV
ncbi:hypothetical protein F4804DRAFT_349068 [Jackrogersella minutella]|nr:hypothetical protein F4804DRAFT_349068 [Jackrogersella minutella]